MKTGDDTFDDIYVSKETGKVVGVMLDGRDYKLVPISPSIKLMSQYPMNEQKLSTELL